MKRNVKGFRLNRNGKPILIEVGEVKFREWKGNSFKNNGIWYFFHRQDRNFYYYNS